MLKQQIAIPAYFGSSSDADWGKPPKPAAQGTAGSAGALLGIVVFNPASGPGYTPSFRTGSERAAYQQRINDMHELGAENVVGYVTTNRRDSLPMDTVQREHRFTVTPATDIVTTRNSDGKENPTGWTAGFGPVQVRRTNPELPGKLPGGLTVETNYFWIPLSETTGKFAASRGSALGGIGIPLSSQGDEGSQHDEHSMGLSRTLANIENVKFEIDQYYARWTGVDGMFFDEMSTKGDADDINYYEQLRDHVKTKGGKALVIQNPGTNFPDSMVGVADTFTSFEDVSSAYLAHNPDDWMMQEPPQKFWHAIHSCSSAQMAQVIEVSRTKNAAYIYVTERSETVGVWRHIAKDFAAEILKIEDENAGSG